MHNNDHYRVLLAEVIDEINPKRRDRSYPRVIKRKINKFPVKKSRHRQQRQHSTLSHSAITIAPPSKTEHRRPPAKTT